MRTPNLPDSNSETPNDSLVPLGFTFQLTGRSCDSDEFRDGPGGGSGLLDNT